MTPGARSAQGLSKHRATPMPQPTGDPGKHEMPPNGARRVSDETPNGHAAASTCGAAVKSKDAEAAEKRV